MFEFKKNANAWFSTGAVIGVGDCNYYFSSNGVGSIQMGKCAIISTNFAISCETRAHFLPVGQAIRDNQAKWRRKLPQSVGDEYI